LLFIQALPILKAAWDAGINTIDTANMYSNGDSERIIAKFLKTVRHFEVAITMHNTHFSLVQHPERTIRHCDQGSLHCCAR
jgi:predicted aldo/keto reductase-like oxidoreductase